MKSTSRPVKKKYGLVAIPSTYWLIGLGAVLVALALIVWLSINKPIPPIDLALASGNVLGKSDATITISEFADFQCPMCGQFARQVLPQIEEKYIKTGQVKWVFNHFAFLGNRTSDPAKLALYKEFKDESVRAAEASECANDQSKFWEYANTLFANQAGENQDAFTDANLEKFAQQLDLNMDQFKTCMTERPHLAKIQQSNANAQSLKIPGTPAIFINEDMARGNSLADIEKALQPYLNASR
jgi:protein-disulfide isomerase